MNDLEIVQHRGRRAVRKRYPTTLSRKFKVLGSGARNEWLLRPALGDLIPAELSARASDADGFEEVLLEWRAGETLRPDDVDPARARSGGRVLAAIHAHTGESYGSIDGAHAYGRQADAFTVRWDHVMPMLAAVDRDLARAVDAWARPRIAELRWTRPALIHGDFAATNILWEGSEVGCVIDWEYARYGDPREDWAKIQTGARFPEPNSFALGDCVAAAREGYLAGGGDPSALETVTLYDAYYAAVLGAFLRDEERLGWLAACSAE